LESLNIREGDGILLVRLGALGDVVRTLPCVAALRESFPQARLAWVVEPGSSSLLPGAPWLNEIVLFPRTALGAPALWRHPNQARKALGQFLSKLQGFRPALSLDFQGTAKSALIGKFSGARRRLGFDRSGSRESSFLLNTIHVRPSSPRINRVFKNLELLAPLRVTAGPPKFPFPPVHPARRISDFLTSLGDRIPVAVHPGTSLRQAHKRWPEESFGQVVHGLAEEGWAPILTWGPGEETLVRRVLALSRGAGVAAPLTTPLEMRELIASCRLFIGGDTGPMHLAWTQGVPVVVLFGSTDPSINGPLGDRHRILAPAWDGRHPFPRRGDRSVVRNIYPTAVLRAAREILHQCFIPPGRAPAP